MMAYVALLRAVNVGGTGKLSMAELERMCVRAGFEDVRTYIASGNVVFGSKLPEAAVKSRLEAALSAYAGKQWACSCALVTKSPPFWQQIRAVKPGCGPHSRWAVGGSLS